MLDLDRTYNEWKGDMVINRTASIRMRRVQEIMRVTALQKIQDIATEYNEQSSAEDHKRMQNQTE